MTRLQAGPLLMLALFLAGCPVTEPTLTPARKLEGTWHTAIPVTVTLITDFCGRGNEPVATEKWAVTWVATARAGFSNVLDIDMDVNQSAYTPIAGAGCGGASGYVPFTPTHLTATMSSTQFVAKDTLSGITVYGSYTSDLMSLTWSHYECILYCSGEASATGEFKLVRQ